ncbi:hypothetical protein [Paenibacillus sp. FSL M7-0420]|uniref:hypothetical protein n=1 Tax=Paenibacillus sp. FSL M7-0420 TaxID=2921609 RepID=UPI0030FAFEF8
MYTKKLIMSLSLTLSLLALSACGNAEDKPSTESMQTTAPTAESVQTPVPTTEAEQTPAPTAEPEQTPEATAGSNETAAGSADLPKYLPEDFPMPENVTETILSNAEENEGKKTALLIFRTTDSMESVTKLYDDYLASKLGDQSVKTIDPKNLIIQGKTKDDKQSWSIIGGPLASQEGTVEVNVIWSEI